jgi:hypothetical protein
MKNLLYLGRPNLGENLFATPCLEILSKEYDITFLTPEFTFPVFSRYNFIKRVLPIEFKDTISFLPKQTLLFLQTISKEQDWYYAYHHDKEGRLIQESKLDELYNLKRYPVLSDKELDICSNVHSSNRYVCRTRKYMLKLQLHSLQDSFNYDYTLRCPTFFSNTRSNDIIIYQGSKEKLRKLSIPTIERFLNVLPHAIYLVNTETAIKLNFEQKKIKYKLIDSNIKNSINDIIHIFEKSPKVLIGPDAGLTQLAIAYKIPLIWLQSRVVIDWIVDPMYRKYCKVYSKKNLICDQTCLGCVGSKHIKKYNVNGIFTLPQLAFVKVKDLACRHDPLISCLEYSNSEIQEIVELIE